MNKKLFISGLLMVVFLLTVSTSWAAVTFKDDGVQGSPTIPASSVLNDYKTSTDVTLVALGDTATYAVVSSHLRGTRVFGSSSQDAGIWTLDAGKDSGSVYTTAPTASDSGAFSSGWSSL